MKIATWSVNGVTNDSGSTPLADGKQPDIVALQKIRIPASVRKISPGELEGAGYHIEATLRGSELGSVPYWFDEVF